jgi:pimeloyl-ACP methyl ester carboxylesterase
MLPTETFLTAEARLLSEFGVAHSSRRLRLADPGLSARVLETGAGAPLLVLHGSGMSAPTWAPLLARLSGRRVHAFDLPGFGLSDPYDYAGRSLRRHGAALVAAMLDALELERAAVAATSFGAMLALYAALAHPERIASVVAFGIPAVALAGMRGDAYFRAMTTPGVRALAGRAPVPKDAAAARRAMRRPLGPRAASAMPDAFFDVVRATMAMPGWRRAMASQLDLALRRGRPRPENVLADDELRALEVPVRLVLGDADAYGAPAVGQRAVALLPDARLDVVGGGHAPFLDHPALCAEAIRMT